MSTNNYLRTVITAKQKIIFIAFEHKRERNYA